MHRFFANLFKKVYKSNHLGTINITIFPILNVLIAVFKISWELKNRSLVPEIYLDEVIFPQVDGQVHRLWLQFWELWKVLGTFQVRHERKKQIAIASKIEENLLGTSKHYFICSVRDIIYAAIVLY